MRNLLLFLHVAVAVMFIGPTTFATSSFARFIRESDLAGASRANRTSRIYGFGSQAVAVIGIGLALNGTGFGQIWVDTALTLFIVGSVLLFAGHLPAQHEAITALEGGAPCRPATITRLRLSAGLYATTWVAIVWLMVAKPA